MKGIRVSSAIRSAGNDTLKQMISTQSIERYQQEPKKIQVETVMNLLCGRNTFLLAATGFGKSRISEMYLDLLPKDQHGRILGVVVVLNPLDALGNNQVEEKMAAGFSAINLTYLNFTHEVGLNVMNGFYNFVYVSPETFLNNLTFVDIYFSNEFQTKLVLVVVDEAHMIYSWGLVEKGNDTSRPWCAIRTNHRFDLPLAASPLNC
ncbi:hypothetical protein PGTUg99_018528 [Puccinia graminis f. sp. tritici]|uniref:DNA 3'-5' helicase n=1 Tax=Puccinia graminis f. sp. tritici TaxID=56615 RepID=A0A5B0MYZ5_PUCGR|nr:hypothetical protein PGTUg99_018528 [Puccinia graminis f. sp. tritici]